jgi:hypothetical protein
MYYLILFYYDAAPRSIVIYNEDQLMRFVTKHMADPQGSGYQVMKSGSDG